MPSPSNFLTEAQAGDVSAKNIKIATMQNKTGIIPSMLEKTTGEIQRDVWNYALKTEIVEVNTLQVIHDKIKKSGYDIKIEDEVVSFLFDEAVDDLSPSDCAKEKLRYLESQGLSKLTLIQYIELQFDLASKLSKNKEDVNAKNKAGITPLQFAIKCDNKDAVKLLLEKGADANSSVEKDGEVLPLIFFALRDGKHDYVKMLIENGADVNLKDRNGNNVLEFIVNLSNKPNEELIKYLLPLVSPDIKEQFLNLALKTADNKYLKLFNLSEKEWSEAVYNFTKGKLGFHYLERAKLNEKALALYEPQGRNKSLDHFKAKFLRKKSLAKVLDKKNKIEAYKLVENQVKEAILERRESLNQEEKMGLSYAKESLKKTLQELTYYFAHGTEANLTEKDFLYSAQERRSKLPNLKKPALGENTDRGGSHFIFGWISAATETEPDSISYTSIVPDGPNRKVFMFNIEELIKKHIAVLMKGHNGNFNNYPKLHIGGAKFGNLSVAEFIYREGEDNNGKGHKELLVASNQERLAHTIKEQSEIFSFHQDAENFKKIIALNILGKISLIERSGSENLLSALQAFTRAFEEGKTPEEVTIARQKAALEIFHKFGDREGTIAEKALPIAYAAKTIKTSCLPEESIKKLYQAIEKDDLDKVKEVLNELKEVHIKNCSLPGSGITYVMPQGLNFVPSWGDQPPLLYAISQGKDAIVEYLINECGADVNVKNRTSNNMQKMYGTTPLMIAAMKGDIKMVKFLIEKGANLLDVADKNGNFNSLVLAQLTGQKEIVKILVKAGAVYPNNTPVGDNYLGEKIARDEFSETLKTLQTQEEKIDYIKNHFAEFVQAICTRYYFKFYKSDLKGIVSDEQIESLQLLHPEFKLLDVTRFHHGADHICRSIIAAKSFIENFSIFSSLSNEDKILSLMALVFHDAARDGDGLDDDEEKNEVELQSYLKEVGMHSNNSIIITNKDKIDAEKLDNNQLMSLIVHVGDQADVCRVRENYDIEYSSLFNILKSFRDKGITTEDDYKKSEELYIRIIKEIILLESATGALSRPCGIKNHEKILVEPIKGFAIHKNQEDFIKAENCFLSILKEVTSHEYHYPMLNGSSSEIFDTIS